MRSERAPGWLLCLGLAACGGAAADADPAPVDAAAEASTEPDAGSPEPERCQAPPGVSASPRSIAEVVALLNALPKPVTLPCFLETLARPLALHAANSIFSLQPAVGSKSPRIFLFFDPLILSVVPAGDGAALLEFGERRGDTTSLKAELEFPITEPLDVAAPFRRLPFDATLSTCGVCHSGEQAAADVDVPFAMISQALRPRDEQRVPLAELSSEAQRCDPGLEPERCALLDTLVRQAPLPVERAFPSAFNTFF